MKISIKSFLKIRYLKLIVVMSCIYFHGCSDRTLNFDDVFSLAGYQPYNNCRDTSQQEAAIRSRLYGTDINIINQGNTIQLVLPNETVFYFDDINPDFIPVLDSIYLFLEDCSRNSVEVSGHTDNSKPGRASYIASSYYAYRISDYLIRKGDFNISRFRTRGYSYFYPVESNSTKDGRKNNNRIEITIFN